MQPLRAVDAHNRGRGGGGGVKMMPWRVCRPVVVDSHNFDEQQDPDPHLSETYESGSAFR